MTTEFIPETDEFIASLLVPVGYGADEEYGPLAEYNLGRETAFDQLRSGAVDLASFDNDVNHSPWTAPVIPEAVWLESCSDSVFLQRCKVVGFGSWRLLRPCPCTDCHVYGPSCACLDQHSVALSLGIPRRFF
jgi:hypothetical protein